MGTQADQVRADIEDTRQHMGTTIDQIEDRASPHRIMERRKQRMRNGARHARDRVMGSADDAKHSMEAAPQNVKRQAQGNPLAAGLMSFAGGLVLAAVFPSTREEKELARKLEPGTNKVKDHLSSEARHIGDEMKPKVQQAADTVKGEASSAADHVKQEAGAAGQDVKSEAQQVRSSAG